MKSLKNPFTCLIAPFFLIIIMGTKTPARADEEFKPGVYGNLTEDSFYTFRPDGTGRHSDCGPDGDCGHFSYFSWKSQGKNAEVIFEYSPWKKEGSKELFKPETGTGGNYYTFNEDLTAGWMKNDYYAFDRDYKARLQPGTYYNCVDSWRDCPNQNVLRKKDKLVINEDLTGYIEEKGQRRDFVIEVYEELTAAIPDPPSFIIYTQEGDVLPLFGHILREGLLSVDSTHFCPLAPCQ